MNNYAVIIQHLFKTAATKQQKIKTACMQLQNCTEEKLKIFKLVAKTRV